MEYRIYSLYHAALGYSILHLILSTDLPLEKLEIQCSLPPQSRSLLASLILRENCTHHQPVQFPFTHLLLT